MHENDYKKVCGQLIGYYRKENWQRTHRYRYTQRGMIEKDGNEKTFKHQKTLCSTTTMRHIEQGIIHRNEALYISLAQKVSKSYFYSRQYHHILDTYYIKVYQSIEQMDIHQMKDLLKGLYQQPFQNLLYYDEVSNLLKDLLLFYLYEQLPDVKRIDVYQAIYPFLEPHLKDMIAHLLYVYYRKEDYQPDYIHHIIHSHQFQKKDILYFYTYIPFMVSWQQFVKVKELLAKFRKLPTYATSAYMQFYDYSIQACVAIHVDFGSAKKLLNKGMHILNQAKNIASHHYSFCFYNLGLLEVFLHEYQKALFYFQKAIALNPSLIFRILPYFFEACFYIGNTQSQLILATALTSANTIPKGLYGAYYHYFVKRVMLKNNDVASAKYLENIIKNQIWPALKIPRQQAYRSTYLYVLFQNELYYLSHISDLKK